MTPPSLQGNVTTNAARRRAFVTALIVGACAAPVPSRPAPTPARTEAVVTVPAPAAAANPPAPAAPALAPAHQRLAEIRALLETPSDDRATMQARCRELTGFDKPFDECNLDLLANGTAPAVAVVYECGAHLCSVDYYIWLGESSQPVHVRDAGTVALEVSPDQRYLLESRPIYGESLPMDPVAGETVRVDPKTGERVVIADCFSTVLSPGARWYVCRDVGGNVLRFPVAGGRPELVVRARIPDGDRLKLGGPFDDYPGKVSFPSARELEYELYLLETERVLKLRAPWNE